MRHLSRFAAAGTAALVMALMPAMAQQNPGGLRLTGGVEQRLEAGRNLGLAIPAEGSTLQSVTRLSLGLDSETRTERFSIGASSALRFGRGPGGRISGFDDPQLRFSYAREGARSGLDLGGSYRRSQVEFLRALSDFADEDGVIVLPEDFEDLTGSGRRTERALRGRLELGRDMPLGLVLNARHSGIGYSGVTNPDLFDTRRDELGATLRMQLSPVATATLGAGRNRYRAENAAQTRRITDRLDLGLAYDVSPVLRLDAGLGWRRIDSREFGVTTRREGATGRLGLVQTLPDGEISARFNADRDQTGTRQTLRVGRKLDRPDGEISGSIGLTRTPAGRTEAIGDLAWRRDLPAGSITAQLSRSVAITGADETRLRTLAGLTYRHAINENSAVSLRFDYSQSSATATQNRLRRTDLNAVYSHQMTRDWALNLGANYRVRQEQGVGRSAAPSVFLTLGRQFDLRL